MQCNAILFLPLLPMHFQHKQSHCLQNLDRSRNEVFIKQPPHSNVQNKEVLMKERENQTNKKQLQ